MNRILTGISVGIIAGIIDLIPMIIQGLTWDANISAFCMWIIIGLLTATNDFKLNPIIKGIVIAFMVLFPPAILIAWNEPISLIPITIMTLILGGLQGFTIDKLKKRQNKKMYENQ